MTSPGAIRAWITDLEPGAVFTIDDVQKALPDKSRDAIKATLSRVCKDDDPMLMRAVRGLYSRRRTNIAEYAIQHWGCSPKEAKLLASFPPHLEVEVSCKLPWMIAGKGAGHAPPNAINGLGWSTQMPAKTNIAVVGRPPTPPDGTVRYFQRSNTRRRELSRGQVTILEAISGFDLYSEMDWDKALIELDDKRRRYNSKSTINKKLFLEVAGQEAYRGPTFLRRCQEITELYDT